MLRLLLRRWLRHRGVSIADVGVGAPVAAAAPVTAAGGDGVHRYAAEDDVAGALIIGKIL